MAQGNFDDQHFNYTEDFEGDRVRRMVEVGKAERMLEKRGETHRVGKFSGSGGYYKEEDSVYGGRN